MQPGAGGVGGDGAQGVAVIGFQPGVRADPHHPAPVDEQAAQLVRRGSLQGLRTEEGEGLAVEDQSCQEGKQPVSRHRIATNRDKDSNYSESGSAQDVA